MYLPGLDFVHYLAQSLGFKNTGETVMLRICEDLPWARHTQAGRKTSSVLISPEGGKHYYYPHFIDEESDASRYWVTVLRLRLDLGRGSWRNWTWTLSLPGPIGHVACFQWAPRYVLLPQLALCARHLATVSCTHQRRPWTNHPT